MAKKTQGTDQTKKDQRIERTSDSFVSYYSNDTQIQTGPWDVRFVFGTVSAINKAERTVEVVRAAEVRMSPQHALRIYTILGEHLERYVKNFGPIPQPKGLDD